MWRIVEDQKPSNSKFTYEEATRKRTHTERERRRSLGYFWWKKIRTKTKRLEKILETARACLFLFTPASLFLGHRLSPTQEGFWTPVDGYWCPRPLSEPMIGTNSLLTPFRTQINLTRHKKGHQGENSLISVCTPLKVVVCVWVGVLLEGSGVKGQCETCCRTPSTMTKWQQE